MRDNTKTLEYYEMMYEQDTYFINSAERRLKKMVEKHGLDYEKIPNCYAGASYKYFHRFYLSYSMGRSYEELLPDVEKFVEHGIKSCDGEPYEDMEYLLYVIIIFGLDKFKEGIKEKILEHTGYQDKYIEELYQLLEPEFPITEEKFFWEKDCKTLDEVINLAKTDKEAATKKLKEFMDKQWFKNLNEGLISREGCYRGFWCLEAAALVKALELDDTELKDSKYYPYDMAHFCD